MPNAPEATAETVEAFITHRKDAGAKYWLPGGLLT